MKKKTTHTHYSEKRPWGSFTQFVHNTPATVKLLFVKAGESLSLQYHHHREEFWRVLSGTGTVVIDKKRFVAKQGKEFSVPKKALHRITATTDLQILEIATGAFDENDIVRVDDRYGRTQKAVIKKKQ